MIQSYGWKFKADTDYLNQAERNHFKLMMEAGVIGLFRIKGCERCNADIPKGKRYCSKACKEAADDVRADD